MKKRYIQTLMLLLAALLVSHNAKAQEPGTSTVSTGPTVRGNVFGGGNLANVKGSVTVNVSAGTVANDVYGGGNVADVNGDTRLHLLGGTITGNVYGGGKGQLATAAVGTPGMDGYVPAKENVEAKVGSTLVNLNGMDATEYKEAYNSWGLVNEGEGKPYTVANTAKGCVVGGSIFGCNNINGTPLGDATVHVYKTQNAGATQIGNTETMTTAKQNGAYDLTAVYGGGNLAPFVPTADNASTHVIIDGCDLTSIETVYGGGNAASTPATDVTVNGTFEIKELFGGGNGLTALPDGRPNPGANVGYKDYTEYVEVEGRTVARDNPNYDTKEERTASGSNIVYGSGAANVTIYGGTIHQVFGGSNTKGNVRISAVTLLDDNNDCDFRIDEAYGGGKSAPMDAEAKLLMACIPGLKAAYGGAEAANIEGNVTLNITNGTFDRVFGGNNISGTISGKITVNIEETGCRPVVIGELYGGGNLAAYSIYGYNDDGTPKESGENPFDNPEVNVRSCTSIGAVYGGGYGTSAKMIASPTVNINESVGSPETYPTTGDYDDNGFKGKTITLDEGKPNEHTVTLPAHKKGEMGAIGNIFGGGNAADVKGNTNVNVGTSEYEEMVSVATGDDVTGYYTRSGEGTEASPYTYTEATGTAVEGTTYYQKVEGANITGNVYGGGNNAEVTGNTHVVIGKKYETP